MAELEEKALFLDTNYLHGNEIVYVTSEINDHYPLHFHEYYEIEILKEGEGYEIINGSRVELAPNRVLLLHPSDYHEIFATKPLKLYNLAFAPQVIDNELISSFLNYDTGIVIDASPNKLAQIKGTLDVIQQIYFGHRTYRSQILIHLTNALLLMIFGGQIRAPKAKHGQIEILKYIQENFANSPSLDEVAKKSGYQKNYFCSFFKKKMGMTYKDYLTNVKIGHAKKLLRMTSERIKDIAIESGFRSANNFIRSFKSLNGITPEKYRSLYNKTPEKTYR